MKVLLIAQEAPLAHDQVVTGNAIRSQQLTSSLQDLGRHRVIHTWFSDDAEVDSQDSFHDSDSLSGLIDLHQPDVLLVSYWELLEILPTDLAQPVILDFLAPRTLELLYQQPEQLQQDFRRLKANLTKVDRVMIGHKRQGALLVNLLIESGFDLRNESPLMVVPLAAETHQNGQRTPHQCLSLVAGGVSWPWRQSESYWQAVAETAKTTPSIKLSLFGGRYRLNEGANRMPMGEQLIDGCIHRLPLCAYQDFSRFLSEDAHIGLEVAEHNIEREYSLSFRSVEFLRHGLPLICNRYLPIAGLVESYDAGWLVDNEEELQELIAEIAADPRQLKRKSNNALRLTREKFSLGATTGELLVWLESPKKSKRISFLVSEGSHSSQEVALNRLPLGKRVVRCFQLISRVAAHKLLQSEAAGGENVVIVTRGDLFPADHGAAVKIVETARGLSNNHLDVAIVTDNRKHWWLYRDGKLETQTYPLWLRLLALPQALVRLLHLSKDIPESNAFLYLPLTDSSFIWRSLYVGRLIGVGIFQAEFPAYARACIWGRNMLGARAVLVEHNVEYDRLRAQLPEMTDTQYQNLKNIEVALCNQSDAVICVSDNDRRILTGDGVRSDLISTIPHGVNLSSFKIAASVNIREKYGIPEEATVLVYHGTFAYKPNLQAIQIFNAELLPRLDKLGVECHVLAVGRDAPKLRPHPRIHFTGSVGEVAPWLKAADIAVVPLIEGGGTRMKIIDYFAAELPVVSTSKGIEGIPVENGEQAIIEDDWGEMAVVIAGLVKDRSKADNIAAAGHMIAESLDWTALARRYIATYATL